MKYSVAVFCMLLVLAMSVANATAPILLNYQGRLTTPAGSNVTDGSYSVTFTIYDSSSDGTSLWTEKQTVTVTGGLFNTLLGSVNPITDTVLGAKPAYLGIKVNTDPELSPRSRLTPPPFALRAEQAAGWSELNDTLTRLSPGRRILIGADSAHAVFTLDAPEEGMTVRGTTVTFQSLADVRLGVGTFGTTMATANSGAGRTGYDCIGSYNIAFDGSNNIGVRTTGKGGTTSYGLFADVSGAAQMTAVYGSAPVAPNSYAGWFEGSVNVNGTLSKSAGSFKIDHPLDPEHKYLQHSFVESPDMMNIYNGNIVTGVDGYATVVLPDWFGALNKDFRYQLTVIGDFAQAVVSSEVKDNRFVIRSDKPGIKVSWQVTGIRRDPYAEAHRIPVEIPKAAEDIGFYLHPEVYGLSEAKGIGHRRFAKAAAVSPGEALAEKAK